MYRMVPFRSAAVCQPPSPITLRSSNRPLSLISSPSRAGRLPRPRPPPHRTAAPSSSPRIPSVLVTAVVGLRSLASVLRALPASSPSARSPGPPSCWPRTRPSLSPADRAARGALAGGGVTAAPGAPGPGGERVAAHAQRRVGEPAARVHARG
uniref:ATP sulfurylase n=1 Tax=Arundo donax TaxID=35708 RepID=A0A0A9FRV7_ARUDO